MRGQRCCRRVGHRPQFSRPRTDGARSRSTPIRPRPSPARCVAGAAAADGGLERDHPHRDHRRRNPALKLKPGLTANARVEIAKRDAALRAERGRCGSAVAETFARWDQEVPDDLQAGGSRVRACRRQTAGGPGVKVGITDGVNSEIIGGELPEQAQLATGMATFRLDVDGGGRAGVERFEPQPADGSRRRPASARPVAGTADYPVIQSPDHPIT